MMLFQQVSLRLVSLALCLTLLGCEQQLREQTDSQLQLGTNSWPGYEPLYLARSLNSWQPDQVRLIEYPSSTEAMRAFRNGSIDAASLTMDETLSLYEDSIPIWIVLIHDISNGGDVIMARPEISSMQDLKGKTVAVETSALGAFITTRALSLNGLTPDDIVVHSSHVSSNVELYKSGQIDAAVTFEPMRTRLLNLGAQEIFSSREIPGEIVDVLVVRQSYAEQYPEQIQALVDGWFQALDFLQQQPEQSYSLISDRLNLSAQETSKMFEGITIPNRQENISYLSNQGQLLSESASSLNQIMLEHNLINGIVDFQKLPRDTFVKHGHASKQGIGQ